MADANAPIDVVGTGSFIPDSWHETYATADIVEYDGKPMVKDGFGSWFAAACKQAGVPGRAHGLRKALAVKLAEAGATPLEIGAILGNDMGAFYARKANRGKLAAAALSRLSAPSPSGKSGVTG